MQRRRVVLDGVPIDLHVGLFDVFLGAGQCIPVPDPFDRLFQPMGDLIVEMVVGVIDPSVAMMAMVMELLKLLVLVVLFVLLVGVMVSVVGV